MKISVIIPNYNGEKLLINNLPKVIQAVGKDAEIIVVDDASVDNSVQIIKQKFPQVKLIEQKQNLRFAATCNSGVKNASNHIVLLLNSDVIPQPGFLDYLVPHFQDNLVFSVGCKEIEIKDGKKIISGRTQAEFCKGLLLHWKPKDQQSLDTYWNFGGSMVVDRSKFLQLSGFDQIYAPAYWEDIDLSYRAKQKGWKVLFEKNAVVYHKHETTNISIFGKKEIEIMSFRNQLLFVWKNIRGIQLIEHFIWLPYHLIFTSIKSKGEFVKAFAKALIRYFQYDKNIK